MTEKYIHVYTSSKKPEAHNIATLPGQGRATQPRLQRSTKDLMKFGRAVFEICERTDTRTRSSQHFALPSGAT